MPELIPERPAASQPPRARLPARDDRAGGILCPAALITWLFLSDARAGAPRMAPHDWAAARFASHTRRQTP